MGREGAADKYHWPVWGALVVFQPHWVCPHSGRVCVLFPSTLFRLPAALQGAVLAFCGLPRPKPLIFRFSGIPQKHRLGWACVLCLPHPSSSGSQELDERTLPRCITPYPLRGPNLSFWVLVRCALCLFWEADFWLRPSRRMSNIQNLRESLVRSMHPR